jgi:hypothetical protein
VILDGAIIPADREKTASVHGEVITASPRKIGDIARAVLVLTHFEYSYIRSTSVADPLSHPWRSAP